MNVLGLFVKTLKIIFNEKGLKKKPESSISKNPSIRNFNANIEGGWHDLIAQLKVNEKGLNEMQN